MMRVGAPTALVALLLVAACSGGDDAAPSTTVAAPTTAPATTVAPTTAATTIAPPTTAPSATTPAPTTAPPTAPAQDLRAEIEADLNEGEQAYIAAAAAPASPESRAVLEEYFAGTSLQAVASIFDQLVDGGLVVRPNPSVPNVVVVQSDPTLVDAAANSYSVDVCRIDAAVVYTPPATPGGPEIIFNDVVFKELSRTTVVQSNGRWIPTGGVELAPDERGATTCD